MTCSSTRFRLALGMLAAACLTLARPKIEGDRSARVVLAGADGEPPLKAKWKAVGRQAQGFNNEPRYELASYAPFHRAIKGTGFEDSHR